jgi:hypothetical protein
MGQPKANLWIHVVLPALRCALAMHGALPSRNLHEVHERLSALPPQSVDIPFFRMELSAPSSAPTTRMNRHAVTAGRKSAIP